MELLIASLFLALPALAADSTEVPPTPRVLLGTQTVELYPAAMHNVNGLTATLVLSTLSDSGTYRICSLVPESAQPICTDIPASRGTQYIDVASLGIQDNTGAIEVQAVDPNSVGASVLLVRSETGGIAFLEPITLDAASAPPPTGPPPTGPPPASTP